MKHPWYVINAYSGQIMFRSQRNGKLGNMEAGKFLDEHQTKDKQLTLRSALRLPQQSGKGMTFSLKDLAYVEAGLQLLTEQLRPSEARDRAINLLNKVQVHLDG